MGYGSSEGVRDAQEAYKAEMARLIANLAAQYIAAGDASTEDAVLRAGNHYVSGGGFDAESPSPSKVVPQAQIFVIAQRSDLQRLVDDFVQMHF